MESNTKFIIGALIILLIAAVIFNPSITGQVFTFLRAKPVAIAPISTDSSCSQLKTYASCVEKCETTYKEAMSLKKVVYDLDVPSCKTDADCGGTTFCINGKCAWYQ